MILMKYVIFLLLTYLVAGAVRPADWSYENETQWGGQCRVGLSQSPIDVVSRSAVVDAHGVHFRGPLRFEGYKHVSLQAENNGHTLNWSVVPTATAPQVSGGPLRDVYRLKQFNLHWLSEHAIDGRKFPMEIHLLHLKGDLTEAEALKRPDGIAIVAVLVEVRPDDSVNSYALQQLMPTLPQLEKMTSEPVKVGRVDLSRLLSPQPQSVYTYHGSLTSPGCEEVVTWLLMDTPLPISDEQFDRITSVKINDTNNFHSLQQSRRVVFRSAAAPSAG